MKMTILAEILPVFSARIASGTMIGERGTMISERHDDQ